MANITVNITHPKMYKVTKAGAPAEVYATGQQELDEKTAKKLIDRGAAIEVESKAKQKLID